MKSVGWVGWHSGKKEPSKTREDAQHKAVLRIYTTQSMARAYSSGDSEREVFIKEASDQ